MAVISRHRLIEGLLGVGTLGALVTAAAAINETFRVQLAGVLSGDPSNDFVLEGGGLQQVVHTVMGTVHDHATTHTPLVLFALAGVALLLLMFRQ